ncbi:MAG: hypothetical protein ACLPID_19600 [Beijerinckiaceae bacterium]
MIVTMIEETAFARLETEGRLLNAVHKGPTKVPGRFGFRGEIALTFQEQIADEKRPPETSADQVMAVVQAGEKTFPFIAAYLHSFAYLATFVEVLGDTLSPSGKYFMFCDNIDLLKKYRVEMDGIPFFILPIDEATVYNELLELLYLDKSELKKLDTRGKLDRVADTAAKFTADYPKIAYQEGLASMEPLRNRNENRPV